MASKTKDFRETIAKAFVDSLQEEKTEWHKSWRSGVMRPQNIAGNNYRGINYLYLSILCAEKEWTDPRFATFNQIQKNGWHLQKGAKGVQVEYWFPYNKEEKKTISWKEYKSLSVEDRLKLQIIPKYYHVFNAKDIEGIPPLPQIEKNEISPDVIISKLSQNMNVEICNDGGDRAFYRGSEDKIHLPEPEMFDDEYSYNSTALHELAHASGAKHRLGRDMSGFFGSPEYAYEELVAEISSSFMAQHLERCEFQLDNHKAYIQSWIEMVEEDPDILIKAIKEAEKCADYLEYHAELLSEKEYADRWQGPDQIDGQGKVVRTEDMERYGYHWNGMKPLTRVDAIETYFAGEASVYLLYPDGTESLAEGMEQIVMHNGMFGVEREYLKNIPQMYPQQFACKVIDEIPFFTKDQNNLLVNYAFQTGDKDRTLKIMQDLRNGADLNYEIAVDTEIREYDQNRRNEIRKDVSKSGYQPTEKMVYCIRTIECSSGCKRTLKELAQLHKRDPDCMKGSVAEAEFKELAEMCKQQELAQMRAVPVMEA